MVLVWILLFLLSVLLFVASCFLMALVDKYLLTMGFLTSFCGVSILFSSLQYLVAWILRCMGRRYDFWLLKSMGTEMVDFADKVSILLPVLLAVGSVAFIEVYLFSLNRYVSLLLFSLLAVLYSALHFFLLWKIRSILGLRRRGSSR